MRKNIRVVLIFIISAVLVFVCCSFSSVADDDAGDVSHLFLEANLAYRDYDFQKAVDCYEKNIARGISNGDIYYNLGNAYLKAGSPGKAVVNYRRSEMFMPTDEDLKANLQYVQGILRDEIECREMLPLLKSLCFWYYWFNIIEFTHIFLAINFLLWTALSIKVFYKNDVLRMVSYALLFCAVVFSSSFAAKLYNFYFVDRGVVIAKEITVRAGNSPNDTVLFNLHEGTEFFWTETNNGWVKVRLCDNKKGWVKKEVVERIKNS